MSRNTRGWGMHKEKNSVLGLRKETVVNRLLEDKGKSFYACIK